MMDRDHHRPKSHHTLTKINLDVCMGLLNYLLPDMNKGPIVFISIVLPPPPIFEVAVLK